MCVKVGDVLILEEMRRHEPSFVDPEPYIYVVIRLTKERANLFCLCSVGNSNNECWESLQNIVGDLSNTKFENDSVYCKWKKL
jgi:hypothetical protein